MEFGDVLKDSSGGGGCRNDCNMTGGGAPPAAGSFVRKSWLTTAGKMAKLRKSFSLSLKFFLRYFVHSVRL